MQERLASYCLTEPSSGSDAASLQVLYVKISEFCINLELCGQQSVCILQEVIVIVQLN